MTDRTLGGGRDAQLAVGELVIHHDRKTAPQLGHVAA